ncbi:MAG TPA: helix-turn-helix domain-containing protein [Burkholderiaceae bacterium]|nr:helix-turn-helix domain-containing protein [Burkholderiaceae bacterium]
MPAARPVRPLPTYALYGEPDAVEGLDSLHCESIAERSARHDWEIRPHRHVGLLQILYMRRGQGAALLEGAGHAMRGPCLVTVPPLAVHGFRFDPGVEGFVTTIAEAQARRVLGHDGALAAPVFALRLAALRPEHARALQRAGSTLQEEFHHRRPWRGLALDAALQQLLLAVARLPPGAAPAGTAAAPRAQRHVERYRALVDQRFREQPSMADCAAALAITPTQLNRVCQRVLGRSALEVLHARVVLEAKRELAYTTMGVKQIALGLGFADAAYFTRFFQRLAGQAPAAWRRQALAG